jgi:uncharacterized damage-inducible protein DinB
VWFDVDMDVSALLLDLYSRIPAAAEEVVAGLSPEQLVWQPGPDANTIGWLIWHVARVQDDYVAEMSLVAEQMLAVRPESADALLAYLRAVDERVRAFVSTLDADDLERVVDSNWDPPVTLGVRTISIADDGIQHVGQAAYIRGLPDS